MIYHYYRAYNFIIYATAIQNNEKLKLIDAFSNILYYTKYSKICKKTFAIYLHVSWYFVKISNPLACLTA